MPEPPVGRNHASWLINTAPWGDRDPYRSDPVREHGGSDARSRTRRWVVWGGALVLAGLLAVVVISGVTSMPTPEPSPSHSAVQIEPGLLTWPPRGELTGDEELRSAAEHVWRAGRTGNGDSVERPAGQVHLLWAEEIGAGRVVIMQAIGADGVPYVAQAADHGDPAVLELDLVSELPADPPVALAVEYDGNLDMPSLEPGPNAALYQLLREPEGAAASTGFWRYRSSATAGLQLLETKPSGMTETFLHLDASEPAPVVVTGAPNGRAGVLDTITAVRGTLVPGLAGIALRDDPIWGSTGRVEGHEYDALLMAAEDLGVTEASGFVASSVTQVVDGETSVLDLVAVLDGDELVGTACVAQGLDEPGRSSRTFRAQAIEIDDQRVLAAACSVGTSTSSRVHTVVMAAARSDAGSVVVEEDGRVLGGPEPMVIIQLDEADGARLVARIDGASGLGSAYEVIIPAGPD